MCVSDCPAASNSTINCKSQSVDCSNLVAYSSKVLATYCFPNDTSQKILDKVVTDILNIAPLQSYFSDLAVGWPLVCWMILVSFGISLIYSILIRYFAGCMVWTMIIVLLILLLGIGLVEALIPSTQFLIDLFDYDSLPDTLKDRNFQIAVSVITLFMFTIGVLIVCCMRRQITICKLDVI